MFSDKTSTVVQPESYKNMKLLLIILFYLIYIEKSELKKSYPVLEFKPQPDSSSTLIWYKSHNETSKKKYKEDLDNFLKPYLSKTKPENAVVCNQTQPPPKNKFCLFEIDWNFGPCLSRYGYGFDKTSGPCVLLRFSQIPENWIPETYNSGNLPEEMPEYLQDMIKTTEARGKPQKVWIFCEGENPADIENIGARFHVPEVGFPVNYFYNSHLEGYLSPLVGVHFENPQRGVLINVECTAWAKNLPRDRGQKLGLVHFELMVDF